MDRNICHESHYSASRYLPSDDNLLPSDGLFYPRLTPIIDTFSCTPLCVLTSKLAQMRNFSVL